jgi:DNA-binding IclR family transcriptional regulator
MSRKPKRPDEDYEIESLTKGLVVLEALEGEAFEPVPVRRIVERAQLPRDTVDRTLKTLRLRGYAKQNDRGEWMVGERLLRLSNRYAEVCLHAIAKGSS